MDINLELLSIQNPWWTGESKNRHKIDIDFDPVIDAYNHQPLRWRPEILNRLDLRYDKIYALFGARGVGKTTILKLLIKNLTEEKKVNPDNIFYYSCHNLETYEQLNEIIKTFLKSRRQFKIPSSRLNSKLYIFIDEISLIKNWQNGLLFLAKAGQFKDTTVVSAGSALNQKTPNSEIIKILKVKMVSSLNFKEFIQLINPEIYKKVNKKNYKIYQEQLEYYLDIYFLTGGFLAGINDFKQHGAIRQSIYSNYLYWLIADLSKLGRDMNLARQILEKVISNLGQPIGYKTIAKKTRAKTHLTAAEYLEILESMFAVKMVYQQDKGQISTSKAKKIYFTDPFLFWLFYSYVYGSLDYWRFSREHLHKENIFSSLVENVIFSHLSKNATLENWTKQITYWRDNIKKQEINFLVRHDKKIIPILIKYNGNVEKNDANIFKKAGFNEGIIISKNELDNKSKIKILPLTYFLLFN